MVSNDNEPNSRTELDCRDDYHKAQLVVAETGIQTSHHQIYSTSICQNIYYLTKSALG